MFPILLQRVRRLEVYDLHQPHLHKLEGELQIKTNLTGSEMTLTGKTCIVLSSSFL